VAMPETKVDLWGHVQRSLLEPDEHTEAEVIPLPTPTRDPHLKVDDLADGPIWHVELNRQRADAVFTALEQAAGAGDDRKVRRLSRLWLSILQADRRSLAAEVSKAKGWRFEAIGRGPLVDRPTVVYRDRLPWVLRPADAGDDLLSERAARIRDRWADERVFDGFVVADEPNGHSPIPCRSLIGVLSPDGRTAEWFILDRWGC
jgi:hypothetical protein